MTDPDAAGGGGEYEVVVGKSRFLAPPLTHQLCDGRAIDADGQDSDGRTE
jgi:hypothetical protein